MHPFLQQLLAGQAVEWKPLGEVCSMITTGKLNANAMEDDGIYPFFTCNENPYRINEYAFDMEAILISGNGSQVGHINYYSGKFNAYQRTYVLGQFISEINIIYLVHYFKFCLKEYILVNSKKGSVPYITLPMLQNFQIPIPPLELQKEIVKRLDILTELEATLEATLEAELTLRKKQYQYYRDFLLSENELAKVGFEWKHLGEIASYSKSRISFEKLDESNYVGVDNLLQNRAGKTLSNYVPTSGNLTEFIKDDILIGNIRPYLKKIWHANCTGGTNGDVLVIRVMSEKINPRYLYQVLADDKFFDYNMKHAKGAKMPRGNKEAILNYQIPIPPLDTQAKIVAILDKFDHLTSSITDGLPKEIELRRKQYEYYRELLLGFGMQTKNLHKMVDKPFC